MGGGGGGKWGGPQRHCVQIQSPPKKERTDKHHDVHFKPPKKGSLKRKGYPQESTPGLWMDETLQHLAWMKPYLYWTNWSEDQLVRSLDNKKSIPNLSRPGGFIQEGIHKKS